MANILVSFSGGKTSAYMARKIKEEWSDKHNLLFVFANTGQEHEKTLDFVDRVDREYELNLVWVEAVVHTELRACTHKVVSYEKASRKGEPFESVIEKYGIPNMAWPHCNRELKINPIHDYAEQYFDEEYKTAIGIRVDEQGRIGKSPNIIYPLATTWPTDKQDVNQYWEDQAFTLEIPEHHGNCKTCWKKSDRKLFTLSVEHPEWFDFFKRMEKEHARSGHFESDDDSDRVFFRGNRTVDDIFHQAESLDWKMFVEDKSFQYKMFGYDMDADSGCTESCEIE